MQKFRMDRATALYNTGIWLVIAAVGVITAFVVERWSMLAAGAVGALTLGAVATAVVLAVRPPWIVAVDDEQVVIRSKPRVRVPLGDVRGVERAGVVVVLHGTSGELRLPPVGDPPGLAKYLRAQLIVKSSSTG